VGLGISLSLAGCGGGDAPIGDATTGGNTSGDTSGDTGGDTGDTGDTGDAGGAGKSKVYVVRASDRVSGLNELLGLTSLTFANGRDVVLKPNLNSANAFPASTHDDTIRTVTQALKDAGCGAITLAESSGPDGTAYVIDQKGTLDLCNELGITFLDFDTMPDSEWETFDFVGNNWPNGLAIPKIMRSEHAVVLLPCCKTHAYGGRFTLSLKLAVGLTPKGRRMALHSTSNILSWIADINYGFTPDLIVMDAMSVFISGGPDVGTLANPGLLLASQDRVAMDAVAAAVLRDNGAYLGNNDPIFSQGQIARAVEIGLGALSPNDIELVGNNDSVISRLRGILDAG